MMGWTVTPGDKETKTEGEEGEPHEFELTEQDTPVCPYCGHPDGEWWDGWSNYDNESFRTCEECDREYMAIMITTFDSRKLKDR